MSDNAADLTKQIYDKVWLGIYCHADCQTYNIVYEMMKHPYHNEFFALRITYILNRHFPNDFALDPTEIRQSSLHPLP